MAGFFYELKRRRMPQALSIYVAASWGVVEALDWLTNRYSLPGELVDASLAAVMLVTWYHGAQGRDQWGRPEKIGVPINGIAAIGVFVWLLLTIESGAPFESVAVLPFVNMSADIENEYFADGLSEELMHSLAGIKGLKVAGRTSSFYFKGKNENLTEIGRVLGVAHILEGSVRERGDTLRITAELISVADGFHLWSETYDRKISDVLAIQADISRQVAGQLRRTLLTDAEIETLGDRGTDSPQAFQLYAIARAQERERSPQSERQAYANFKKATELDPEYAEAWAGVVTSLVLLGNNFGIIEEGADKEAFAALETAMTLNPESSAVWHAKGALSSGLMPAGFRVFRMDSGQRLADVEAYSRAVELDPKNVQALSFLANAYEVELNDHLTAVEYYRRALDLDPLERSPRINLADSLFALDRVDEAMPEYTSLPRNYPNWFTGWAILAMRMARLGQLDTAMWVNDKALEILPDAGNRLRSATQWSLAMGDMEAARAAFAMLGGDEMAPMLGAYFDAMIASDWAGIAEMIQGEEELMSDRFLALLQLGDDETLIEYFQAQSPGLFLAEPEIKDFHRQPFFLARIVSRNGDIARARLLIDALLKNSLRTESIRIPHDQRLERVAIHAMTGELDAAIDELTIAVDQGFRETWLPISGFSYGITFVRLDKNVFLEELHDDPRFIALIERMDADNAKARARLDAGQIVSPLDTWE